MSKRPKSDDQSSSFAAEQIGGNEDLIREILLYLPSRSLIRFKSVSKQWRSLIKDPQFGRHHTNRRNPSSFLPSGLFFYDSLTNSQHIGSVSLSNARAKIPSFRIPDPARPSEASMKITQSCNGLFLLRFTVPIETFMVTSYAVRNFTTGQFKLFSFSKFLESESIALAYDPSKSPYYKIICVKKVKSLPNLRLYNPYRIEIYSSESDEWRVTDVCFEKSWLGKLDDGLYWNGAIHWIFGDGIRFHGLRFDVEVEEMTRVEMPPRPADGGSECLRYFGECNGHLHLVYVRSRVAKKFNVLEKDRDTLKWNVKYRVHISRLLSAFPDVVVKGKNKGNGVEESQYAFSILCVVRGENEEDSALVLTIPGKVISYNFMSKKAELLSELPFQVVETPPFEYVSAFPFVETLYPV